MTQRSIRGFALVDVIVAAVLMGVSLAVVIGLIGQSVTSQHAGQRLATAAALADEQLSLVLARGPDDYAKRYPATGRCDAPFADYSYELQFTNATDSEPYKVTVVITWATGVSPQSLRIQTLMAAHTGEDSTTLDRKPEEAPERIP